MQASRRQLIIIWILVGLSLLIKIPFIFYFAKYHWHSIIWCHPAADVNAWWHYFGWIKKGLIPGIDFGIEYPSGALALFSLLLSIWKTEFTFYLGYGLFTLFFDMLTAYFLFKTCTLEKVKNITWIMGFYLFCPTILALNNARFDIIPAALTIIAYYYYRKGKLFWPAVMLGLGITLKWSPIFMVMAIGIKEFFSLKNYKKAILLGSISFLCFATVEIIFILANYFKYGILENWFFFYDYQAHRPIYFDTTINLIRWFIKPDFNPGMWPFIITFGLIFLISVFHNPRNIIQKYVLYCFAFLFFNKVYSPQFHIWFFPFLLLCFKDRFWPKVLTEGKIRISKLLRAGFGLSPFAVAILESLNILIFPFCVGFICHVHIRVVPCDLIWFKIFVVAHILRTIVLTTIGIDIFFFHRKTRDNPHIFR